MICEGCDNRNTESIRETGFCDECWDSYMDFEERGKDMKKTTRGTPQITNVFNPNEGHGGEIPVIPQDKVKTDIKLDTGHGGGCGGACGDCKCNTQE